MLQIKNVTKAFNNKVVLEDLSLQIPEGAFTVITGASGTGKTTLLNILGGLEKPDSGEVLIDDQLLCSSGQKLKFHRNQAGFLFQNYALVNDKTVAYNLKIGCSYRKMENKSEAVKEALALVGLSGIEKKRKESISCLVVSSSG